MCSEHGNVTVGMTSTDIMCDASLYSWIGDPIYTDVLTFYEVKVEEDKLNTASKL